MKTVFNHISFLYIHPAVDEISFSVLLSLLNGFALHVFWMTVTVQIYICTDEWLYRWDRPYMEKTCAYYANFSILRHSEQYISINRQNDKEK